MMTTRGEVTSSAAAPVSVDPFVSVTGEGGTSGVPVNYPGDLFMRHRAPRPLTDLLRRLPRATARPLGKLAQLSPGRALVALMAVLSLGTGAYVAVASSLGDSSNPQAGSAALGQRPGPTVSRDGERPHLVETPTSTARAPQSSTSEPRTSAAAQTQATQVPDHTDSMAPSPAIGATPTPRTELSQPAGSPSTGSVTPSTSPSPQSRASSSPHSDASSSPTPEDQTPPNTSLFEELLGGDSALFSFSANEPATFTCSLDGAAYASCDSPRTYSDLDSGWHTLAVRATDAARNVDPSPAEVRWHASEGRLADH